MNDRFEERRREWFSRQGFDAEGRWMEDRQGRSTYLLERRGEGRPIVLVHGGLSDAGIWSLLAPHLPGWVVVPDRPGYGLSYRIDYRSVDDYRGAAAKWMEDLVDGLGVDVVDLVGNSMGGFFSMAFATAHPDRVGRMVPVGAPAGLDRWIPRFLRLWGNPVMGPLISRMQPDDPEALRTRVFSELVAHPEAIPRELLQLAVEAAALPGTGTTSHTMLRSVLTVRGWRPELMMREAMAGLDVPTLFLWGAQDSFAPPQSGHDLAEVMPRARIEVLEGSGHLPQIDEPERVASATTSFLTAVEP